MGKFLVRKVADNGNEGFTETLEYHVMHQSNVSSNHNKFYLTELQKHPDGRHRIFTHYGRLGISNIYEVRDTVDGQPCRDYNEAKREFDSIHKKKLSGKSVKDPETGEVSREAYVDIEVVSPQVGSVNIRDQKTVTKQVSIKTALDTSSYTNPHVSKLLDQLVEENIHAITSQTAITYSSNGFSTALGPVTKQHVDRARIPLNELNKIMGSVGKVDFSDKAVQRLNSDYFSLIPKPFSRKIADTDMILDANALQAEYDILDQLATGVTLGAAMSGSASQKMNALGTDIEYLEDGDEIKRITKYIQESKANNHRNEDVWNYRVNNIFKIKIPKERSRFETLGKNLGNVREFFHGTSVSNGMSILHSGLIIPPTTAGHVTGRLFSNGVYFSSMSTKSLRYSLGYWGTKRSRYNNAILFLADVALGNTYVTHDTHYPYRGAKPGFDSTSALPNRGFGGLNNSEYIVYRLEQQTLTYLVEMKP